MSPWKLLKSEEAYNGWRQVINKTFLHPKGHEVKVDITNVADDASVIALTKEGLVVIGEQFRCGPEKVMQELVGGMIDEGEEPEHAAIREMAEESGYSPGNIEYIGYVHREGWRSGKSYYFLATDCTPLEAGQKLDDFEVINVKLIKIGELINNAKTANMTDSGGVLLAYDRLRQLEEEYEKTN